MVEVNTAGHVPSRLMALLNNEEVQKSMHWLPDGKSFEIIDPDLFASTALMQHFKGVQFGSFQKSLSQWGFKKTGYKMMDNRCTTLVFSSPLFLRDQPELCNTMQRMTKRDWKAQRRRRKATQPTQELIKTNQDPPKLKKKLVKSNIGPQTSHIQLSPLQMNQLPMNPGIVPAFVPILPMQHNMLPLYPYFLANQQSCDGQSPTHQNLLFNRPPRQDAPKQAAKYRAPKQLAHIIHIQEPRTDNQMNGRQKREVSLTKDELNAAIAIAMLDGSHQATTMV